MQPLASHLRVFFAHAHSVNWSYDDAAGVVTRIYDRPADLQPLHPTPGLSHPITRSSLIQVRLAALRAQMKSLRPARC